MYAVGLPHIFGGNVMVSNESVNGAVGVLNNNPDSVIDIHLNILLEKATIGIQGGEKLLGQLQ